MGREWHKSIGPSILPGLKNLEMIVLWFGYFSEPDVQERALRVSALLDTLNEELSGMIESAGQSGTTRPVQP